MFDWWKDLLRPIRIEDSRFGHLRYARDARVWEGRVHFAPTAMEIDIVIEGERAGPTGPQHLFFKQLEEQYDSLWPAVRARLMAQAQQAQIAGDLAFVLVGVGIPSIGDAVTGPEWTLSYELEPRSWHFTVRMIELQPIDVVAEC